MLYLLDHYYAINHKEYCIVVESDKKVEDMIEICSSIAFLLEDITDSGSMLNMDCLLEILIKYYGACDKKKELIDSNILQSIEMPIQNIYEFTLPCTEDAAEILGKDGACIIDLYEARESCCGLQSKEIMKKWLPEGKQLEELKNTLKTSGVDM